MNENNVLLFALHAAEKPELTAAIKEISRKDPSERAEALAQLSQSTPHPFTASDYQTTAEAFADPDRLDERQLDAVAGGVSMTELKDFTKAVGNFFKDLWPKEPAPQQGFGKIPREGVGG